MEADAPFSTPSLGRGHSRSSIHPARVVHDRPGDSRVVELSEPHANLRSAPWGTIIRLCVVACQPSGPADNEPPEAPGAVLLEPAGRPVVRRRTALGDQAAMLCIFAAYRPSHARPKVTVLTGYLGGVQPV